MRELATLLLLVVATGCRKEAGGARSSGRPDGEVIARVCEAAPCSGRAARVEVWRTKAGEAGRYVHQGDGTVCSHPPMLVFDTGGKELGGIAFEPVVRGSDEERGIVAKREALLGGHERAEVLDCEGRVREAPKP